jgi:hypothetical protein
MNPVNMAQVRRQLRQAANRPLLEQCVHEMAGHALKLGLERLASGQGDGLELQIGDDFDRLPRDVAEDFWADAVGERTEEISDYTCKREPSSP